MQYPNTPTTLNIQDVDRHSKNNCPDAGKQCYNCGGIGHFTSLLKKPRNSRHPQDSCWQCRTWQGRSNSHRHHSKFPSKSRQTHRSTSRNPSYTHNQYRSKRSPTPYRHKVSHISLSFPHPNEAEGGLLTDTVSDGYTSFHTTLQIKTKQGTKTLQWRKTQTQM